MHMKMKQKSHHCGNYFSHCCNSIFTKFTLNTRKFANQKKKQFHITFMKGVSWNNLNYRLYNFLVKINLSNHKNDVVLRILSSFTIWLLNIVVEIVQINVSWYRVFNENVRYKQKREMRFFDCDKNCWKKMTNFQYFFFWIRNIIKKLKMLILGNYHRSMLITFIDVW